MVEIFKDIECFEGLYQVSNFGRVKSLVNNHRVKREKILKQDKNNKGYLQVVLCKDGKHKRFYVHRLVAESFIPNSLNLPQVNHKDENKENNCVNNLEWCDYSYNINYGTRNEKLSKKVICVETNVIYPSLMEAHRQTGIKQSHIIDCCKWKPKHKTAGGFHWQYV